MRTPDEIKKGLTDFSKDGCDGCYHEGECNLVDGVCLLMREAVSCIQNLEATISEMEKVDEKLAWENGSLIAKMPKWNSVKDRLPKRMQTVLVSVQMFGTVFYDIAAMNSAMWIGIGSSYEIKQVTHWMPLPEPPKVDRRGEYT